MPHVARVLWLGARLPLSSPDILILGIQIESRQASKCHVLRPVTVGSIAQHCKCAVLSLHPMRLVLSCAPQATFHALQTASNSCKHERKTSHMYVLLTWHAVDATKQHLHLHLMSFLPFFQHLIRQAVDCLPRQAAGTSKTMPNIAPALASACAWATLRLPAMQHGRHAPAWYPSLVASCSLVIQCKM